MYLLTMQVLVLHAYYCQFPLYLVLYITTMNHKDIYLMIQSQEGGIKF